MAKTANQIISVLAIAFIACILPLVSDAATLTLSPKSAQYVFGKAITINLYVSSPDQAMNAVSAHLSFPTDMLSVTSVSKSDSIIGIWAQDPSFSNTLGTIDLEGVVLTPGFTGSGGKVLSIVFKAKKAGTADIKFLSGSVLANDGNGTALATTLGKATLTITNEAEPQEATTTVALPKAPAGPPVIEYYSAHLSEGDPIVIKGHTDSVGSKILFHMKYGNGIGTIDSVISNAFGDFTFTDAGASQEGIYTFFAESADDTGVKSGPTETYTIHVTSPYYVYIGSWKISIFIVLGFILLLLALLAVILSRAMHKGYRTKKEMHDIISTADKLANVKFKYFNEYVSSQIDNLEKEEQSKSAPTASSEVLDTVRKHIAEYRDYVEKEVNGTLPEPPAMPKR